MRRQRFEYHPEVRSLQYTLLPPLKCLLILRAHHFADHFKRKVDAGLTRRPYFTRNARETLIAFNHAFASRFFIK